jgi:hypothetical protein
MLYKVLIKLYVPEIDEIYEMYIPINKTVGEISLSLCKLINNLTKVYPVRNNTRLFNRDTGQIYERDITIRESDIRNGSQLIIY